MYTPQRSNNNDPQHGASIRIQAPAALNSNRHIQLPRLRIQGKRPMKIKNNIVQLNVPTKEIHAWIAQDIGKNKARILEAKQDSRGRVHITVY